MKKTIVMLDSVGTFSLSKCTICCKKKTFLNVGPKLSYLGIFGLELEKATVLWYFTSVPSNFSKRKIHLKIKILKFATKIALNGSFGLEFQKTNAIFKINILKFVNLQSLIQKQNNFKLETKILISTSNF